MKIYNYKEGKAVFVNNEKVFISENAALLLQEFPDYLDIILRDEHQIVIKPMVAASDAEDVMAASTPGYTVVTKEGNGVVVSALLKDGKILVARKYNAGDSYKGRVIEIIPGSAHQQQLQTLFGL